MTTPTAAPTACECPEQRGHTMHTLHCPVLQVIRVSPSRDDWFDAGTLRPRTDDDDQDRDGRMADRAAAAAWWGLVEPDVGRWAR